MPILHEATCNNYFIVKYLLKSSVARVILLTYELQQACLIYFNANLVKTTSRSKNCNQPYLVLFLFAYFNSNVLHSVLDDRLQSICFRIFCSKYSITFESTYMLTYFILNLNYVNFWQY